MPPQVLIRHLDAEAIRAFDPLLTCEPYEGEPDERLFLVKHEMPTPPAPLPPPQPRKPHPEAVAKKWQRDMADYERALEATCKRAGKVLSLLAEKDHAAGEALRKAAEREGYMRIANDTWSAVIDDTPGASAGRLTLLGKVESE